MWPGAARTQSTNSVKYLAHCPDRECNRPVATSNLFWTQTTRLEFNMVTRIWHGATPATKSDEYLTLMRTIAIPDYRSTPGNKGAYALRRIEGDTAHFLMVTFWESEDAIRAFAGDDISVAKYYDFDKDFLLELEPHSTHYEMYDK
jgi:heme-degrading monooxygenase HmoA